MKPRIRKTNRVMWLVFYHGRSSTNITMDIQAAWNSKRAALASLAEMEPITRKFYSAEKYIRAEE
jgi:hypothetical protein